MKFKNKILVGSLISLFTIFNMSAQEQVTNDILRGKIKQLEVLVKKAEKKKINTLKDRTALRTVEIFMKYADWDEKNVEANVKNFSKVGAYRKVARQKAAELPAFERNEMLLLLNSTIEDLSSVVSGETYRLSSPQIDWAKVSLVNDELIYNGKPVFLADWTWKPTSKYYTDYFGNKDGLMISPSMVQANGSVNGKAIETLREKADGTVGIVFLGHTNIPKWAPEQDATITDGIGIKYTAYDINNPLSREIQSKLIKGTVPYMAGKKYTQLGYMLANEPHWCCEKGVYTAGPISQKAIADFKEWLKAKHGSIDVLNRRWKTSYTDFASIDTPAEVDASLRGGAFYYDFLLYNMYRVNDWFAFLKNEVEKYDSEAKTHIKIMPRYWSDNGRDSGIDFETLSRQSEILGNDASGAGKRYSGETESWEERYSFKWRELCTSYDFLKSVSPEKIILNSEGHILTTSRYRNLYEKPEYARSNYWLATMHGLSAIQSWYWSRREDGSRKEAQPSNGYAGSNNHQPRIVNEVHATMIDLNSVSDKMIEMQRQRKSVRIFYSNSASINQKNYMDSLFMVYESLYFDGLPLGYATENIIKKNKHDWDVILVSNTRMVTNDDVSALQSYLNEGGTVIIDKESIMTNEYGEKLSAQLKQSKGKLVEVGNLAEMEKETLAILASNKHLPALSVKEDNGNDYKTCTWRVVPGYKKNSYIISIVNLGKNKANIELAFAENRVVKSVKNVLNGKKYDAKFALPVQGVLMLEVE